MSTTGGEAATAEQAQVPGITRIDLQRQDLSAAGREVIQNRVEISDEAPAIRHKHPGEEIIYVLEGPSSIRSAACQRRHTTPARL
jgi:quercetin dioxygenase-like cupin family protein